ncbi:MAG: DNA primase [Elusimicrobia bacterium]|nr:DNA primase [Elusimicrobiota bacterium]
MSTSGIIEEIREKTDIVALVKEYVPSLKKAGRTYKARCPFHSERTPSFTVSPDKQMFYCFGCQSGGDVFAFVMKAENMSFSEAAQKLARRAGVQWRATAMTDEDKLRLELKKALEFAKSFYHEQLLSSPGAEQARKYLAGRALSGSTISRFELGWAPADFCSLVNAARRQGFSEDILYRAGLAARGANGIRDYFFGRVLFPITNHMGDTIGLGGRVLDPQGQPKYLNTPETPLFSKGKVLFGLSQAGPAMRKGGKALLLEGYMDVIACHQAGIDWAVAPLGTALGSGHATLLRRYAPETVMMFDPDDAGLKAAVRGAAILMDQGIYAGLVTLEDGLDPDEYIEQRGREAFEKKLGQTQDLLNFQARLILSRHEGEMSKREKTSAAAELAQTILRQPDAIIRSEWVKDAAHLLKIEEDSLRELINRSQPQQRYEAESPQAREQALPAVDQREDDLLGWLLKAPQYLALAEDEQVLQCLSQSAAALVRAMREALDCGVAEAALAADLASRVPELSGLVHRLAVQDVPHDFDAAHSIAECVGNIRKQGLKSKLQSLTFEIKEKAARGEDSTALKQEFMRIGLLLKSSRVNKEHI